MTKRLTFNKFRWYSCTIDFNKGAFCPATFFVYLMGHQFFPGSIRSGYQYPCLSRRNLVNHAFYFLNRFRFTDNLVHLAHLTLKYQSLGYEGGFVHGITDCDKKPVQIERFFKKIVCSLLYCFNSSIYVTMSGNHDYGSI